jgi:cytochrome c peroxidase
MKTAIIFKGALISFAAAFLVASVGILMVQANELTPNEQLGKSIFFDQNLSINQNQSCAVCHAPEVGWAGPLSDINAGGAVYEGSIPGRFGNRKPPSSAYATPSPILHFVIEKKEALFIGGNFWDGRATGEKLGNPAADQAQGPFLNPLEQALPDSACVVYRVCNPVVPGDYPVPFEDVWGTGACDISWPGDVDAVCATEGGTVGLSSEDRAKSDMAYDEIALSIAAFEASPESNAFTSKYDYYLAGMVDLTKEEKKGLNLFKSTGKCANCHILDPGPNGEPPLLTDFTYDNLGVPRNPENPFYDQDDFNPLGEKWIDIGLGGFLETRPEYEEFAAENYGKHKVPTLRNVELRPDPNFVKAYGHNGYFKSLKGIVHFYSTRDVKPLCLDVFTTEAEALAQNCWPMPEVPVNVNTKELGKLNLTEAQEDAIVAFLKTLSDGYQP